MTARTPLPGSAARKAAASPRANGLQAHCRWLRVKTWMAVAPIARPLPGATGTPPAVGTWAPSSSESAIPIKHNGREERMLQVPLPETIVGAPPPEVQERIARAKQALGSRLVILGHHYQRDEVIVHADFTGDSFKLAQLAASRPDAELIVFCGVHFIAESADILSAPSQKVVLPDLDAGCTMADMAETDQVEDCWEQVTAVVGGDVLPVTYMNSAASLKAMVGREGGAVCTS